MRIFLTGATGYMGSAVLDALRRAGHTVAALVRDPEKAERLTMRGVHAILGDLSMPKYYIAAVEACDSIIHAAYEPMKRGSDLDRQAIDALLGAAVRRAAKGQPVSFVYTSAYGSSATRPARPLRTRPCVRHRSFRGCPITKRLVLGGGPRQAAAHRDCAPRHCLWRRARNHWRSAARRSQRAASRRRGRSKSLGMHLRARSRRSVCQGCDAPEASGIYHANDEAASG